MSESTDSVSVIDRVGAHTRGAQLLVLLFAIVIGTYAAWLGGDYGLGLGSLVGFGLVAGWILVRQPTTRAVGARGCYLLAGLVILTPVMLNLPTLTGGQTGVGDPVAMVFHPGVYVMALVFVVLAVVIAGIGVLVDDR